MARPKTILWVDDEVEGLAPHRRFLEDQGFTVAAAAHGDDALAMLRRQPYSVVLLDEQMPGRRGLELLTEIRAIDAGVADGAARPSLGANGSNLWSSCRAGRCASPRRTSPAFRRRSTRCRPACGRTSPGTSPASTRAGSRTLREIARPCRWTWAPSSSC